MLTSLWLSAAASQYFSRLTSKVSNNPFQVYKSCFTFSVIFNDFLHIQQGRWYSSTARRNGYSKLRTSPRANDTVWTVVDSSRPTSTTSPVNQWLNNWDIDNPALPCSYFCDPAQNIKTWSKSSRLGVAKNYLVTASSFPIWTQALFDNTDFQHRWDYMDHIQQQRLCTRTISYTIRPIKTRHFNLNQTLSYSVHFFLHKCL